MMNLNEVKLIDDLKTDGITIRVNLFKSAAMVGTITYPDGSYDRPRKEISEWKPLFTQVQEFQLEMKAFALKQQNN